MGGTALAIHTERGIALPPEMRTPVGEMPWAVPQPVRQSADTLSYLRRAIDELLPKTPCMDRDGGQIAIVQIPTLQGLSFWQMNERIVELNRERIDAWSCLSPKLCTAHAWESQGIREEYEQIVELTARQIETTVRFYELRYESEAAIGQAIEQQDLLGHFTVYGLMQKTVTVGYRRMHHASAVAKEWREEEPQSIIGKTLWERHCDRVRPYIGHMKEANQPRYADLLEL